MIYFSRIKWIGFLLLLMMAVRVSITPGLWHQHEQGDRSHSHSHGTGEDGLKHHHHVHPHGSHAHGDNRPDDDSSHSNRSHVHISIFGWEFTLGSPEPDDEPTVAHADRVASSASQMESLPEGVLITSATPWGRLIQWVMDIRSPSPPGKMELPRAMLSHALPAGDQRLSSKDRDKPLQPPPERSAAFEVT